MSYWFYRLLARLPLWLKYALATPLTVLLRDVIRYRVRTVADNLDRSLPELDAAERDAIARQFYAQLVDTALEITHAYHMSREAFTERVSIRNPEVIDTLSEQHSRSVVVLVIHQGNWEWMLHAASIRLGLPIDPVYKPLHNAGSDRFALELRSRFGAEPVTAATAAKDILRKRRQVRLFALLADQSPGHGERKHWTHSLHRDTAWHTGAATIARLTRSPVCFAQCLRTRRGHYEIVFHEITRDPRSLEEHEIVDRYAALAERAICEQPESYLWSNRRWKLKRDQAVAPSEDASSEQ